MYDWSFHPNRGLPSSVSLSWWAPSLLTNTFSYLMAYVYLNGEKCSTMHTASLDKWIENLTSESLVLLTLRWWSSADLHQLNIWPRKSNHSLSPRDVYRVKKKLKTYLIPHLKGMFFPWSATSVLLLKIQYHIARFYPNCCLIFHKYFPSIFLPLNVGLTFWNIPLTPHQLYIFQTES